MLHNWVNYFYGNLSFLVTVKSYILIHMYNLHNKYIFQIPNQRLALILVSPELGIILSPLQRITPSLIMDRVSYFYWHGDHPNHISGACCGTRYKVKNRGGNLLHTSGNQLYNSNEEEES